MDRFLTGVRKNSAQAGPGEQKSFVVPCPKKWSGPYPALFVRLVEEGPEKMEAE